MKRPCHWCGSRNHRAVWVEESCLDQIVDMEIRRAMCPAGPLRRYLDGVLNRCRRRLPGWGSVIVKRIEEVSRG